MRNAPLHVQVLEAVRKRVQKRKEQHEQRAGRGLEDREYQRHVGRIAECTHVIEDITEIMKSGLDEADDEEEVIASEPKQRRAKSRT